jgi:hypothetical protein
MSGLPRKQDCLSARLVKLRRTGANEQGKSLIIEVVRWCVFGSAALRGKAEDYKTLKATLEFSARGDCHEGGPGTARKQTLALVVRGLPECEQRGSSSSNRRS